MPVVLERCFHLDSQMLPVIDLPLGIAVHVSFAPTITHVTVSTATNRMEMTHVADSNLTNSLLLSINAAKPLLALLKRFRAAVSTLRTSAHPRSRSGKPMCVDCDVPAVTLRVELSHSLVVFVTLQHLHAVFHTETKHLLLDVSMSANYTLDTPLQSLLEGLDLHCECSLAGPDGLTVHVSTSAGMQVNIPWNVVAFLKSKETEIGTRSYDAEIANDTGVSMMYVSVALPM